VIGEVAALQLNGRGSVSEPGSADAVVESEERRAARR